MLLLVRCAAVCIVLSLVGVSCVAPQSLPPAQSEYDNPSRTIHIRVGSVPPGAQVYSLAGSSPGTLLGTTPLLLKYVEKGNIWGPVPNETLEFETDPGGFLHAGSSITMRFRCLVVREGYHPYTIYETLKKLRGFGKGAERWSPIRKNFNALLSPVRSPEQPSPQPQQQQQQQQQQTVIVPAPETNEKDEEPGTVIVSSNVDGAEVLVDGIFVGNAPATLKLKAGIHIIEVTKPGYSSYQRNLRVLAGSNVPLRAHLEPE